MKKFGESVGSILKILAFINIGVENFGELPTIRQNFPTYGKLLIGNHIKLLLFLSVRKLLSIS